MTYRNNYKIIGIDVGWSNLALVVVDVDLDSYDDMSATNKYNFKVVFAKMVDLRKVQCHDRYCMFEKRDRKGAHLVHHYVEMLHGWFDASDKVIIESQPIVSTHKDVEQLLLCYIKQRYSDGRKRHAVLMAPQTLHSYYSMSCDKSVRRHEIVRIAGPYLETTQAFCCASDKDHLCDAMGFVLLFINTLLEQTTRVTNIFSKYRLVTNTK